MRSGGGRGGRRPLRNWCRKERTGTRKRAPSSGAGELALSHGWPRTYGMHPEHRLARRLSLRCASLPSMAAESSFDIVNKPDRQEIDNALNQTAKELANRFDFKGVDAGIKWSGEAIELQANSDQRVSAVLDVFKDKLVKRSLSLKLIDATEPALSGKLAKITVTISNGISQDNAKKISKLIRDRGLKTVKAQIQGDELRVSSKSRDDLQEVQRLVRDEDFDFAVQFVNYR